MGEVVVAMEAAAVAAVDGNVSSTNIKTKIKRDVNKENQIDNASCTHN